MTRAEAARERRDILMKLPPAERRALLARMSEHQRKTLRRYWEIWAHEGQTPPLGCWHTWMIMAGRGYGKTRAGAEWVRLTARQPTARIALVAASLGEARRVMVEGESGILAVSPQGKRPRFEPSKRTLTWESGAQATLYSAAEPESLRGPQSSHARQPGAEGVYRQRDAAPRRPGYPMRCRRFGIGPAGNRRAGAGLAGRCIPKRLLCGARRRRRGSGRPPAGGSLNRSRACGSSTRPRGAFVTTTASGFWQPHRLSRVAEPP